MLDKAIEILKIISVSGYESYIVGGYVRDRILGIESHDFDICTNAKPKDIKRIFNDALIDERYGSSKLHIDGYTYEITTYRKDILYEDNRRPSKIEYLNELEEDLDRRDFTINTICMDKDLNIIDLKNGMEDINNKIIRTVTSSNEKIKEDSLRILRAIRFATTLNFKIDDELDNSIKKYNYTVDNLSYERIRNELDKIFMSDNYINGIKLLKKYSIDKYLGLKIVDIVKTNIYGIWAQIEFDDRYKFSKKELKLINDIKYILKYGKIDNYTSYYYSKESNDIALDILGKDKRLNMQIKSRNEIAISIDELSTILNQKIEDIKEIYNDIEYNIVINKIKNNKEDIINYIKRGE